MHWTRDEKTWAVPPPVLIMLQGAKLVLEKQAGDRWTVGYAVYALYMGWFPSGHATGSVHACGCHCKVQTLIAYVLSRSWKIA
jgi:hypothetical protein